MENKNFIEKIDYKIIQHYEDNPLIRSILYTEKLYKFLMNKDLGLLPMKIINVILSAIKDEQQQFIKDKNVLAETKQLTFDDVFKDWTENTRAQFTISFKSIKLDKDIKNKELYNAFVALSNLHWEIYSDESLNVYELVPFIEGVKWSGNMKDLKADINKKLVNSNRDRFIQFKMHRKTMESLLDMSRFLKLDNHFVMNLKSAKTLQFIFWVSKHINNKGVQIGVEKFCNEIGIKYTYDSKVLEYLNRIRAEMNQSYSFSINYRIENKKLIIAIYDTKIGIGDTNGIDSLEDLKIKRALFNIKKVRNLDELQMVKIEKYYKYIGYETVSKAINRRINTTIIGDLFIQKFEELLNV